VTSPGVNQVNDLSDYAKMQGIAPIEGNPEFSQPTTAQVNIPKWKQYDAISNQLALQGFHKESDEYRKMAREERKDSEEFNLAYSYWLKDRYNWKQNMLRDYPQGAEEIKQYGIYAQRNGCF